MTAYRVIAIVGLVVLSASVSLAADNDAPQLFPDEARKNPYAKLFSGSSVAAPQQPVVWKMRLPRTEKPEIVCGMVTIPVDDSIDPQMRKSPPESDNTSYTIRAVKPPMCTPH